MLFHVILSAQTSRWLSDFYILELAMPMVFVQNIGPLLAKKGIPLCSPSSLHNLTPTINLFLA